MLTLTVPADGIAAAAAAGDATALKMSDAGSSALEKQLLLEELQEKEQLMVMQLQVTQAVMQLSMLSKQSADQEAMLSQLDEAAKQQLQQQMELEMQMLQMMMNPAGMMSANMGSSAGSMGSSMPTAVANTGSTASSNSSLPNGTPLLSDLDLSKKYIGIIKTYNATKGIGIVESVEIQEKYGCPVYLHASQVKHDEKVNDIITFNIMISKLGQPRAKDIKRVSDVHDAEAGVTDGEAYHGTVKAFNVDKGFGFIVCASAYSRYGSDIFVHRDEAGVLSPGEHVRFAVRFSPRGRPQAKDIEKTDKAPEAPPPSSFKGLKTFEAHDGNRSAPYQKGPMLTPMRPAAPTHFGGNGGIPGGGKGSHKGGNNFGCGGYGCGNSCNGGCSGGCNNSCNGCGNGAFGCGGNCGFGNNCCGGGGGGGGGSFGSNCGGGSCSSSFMGPGPGCYGGGGGGGGGFPPNGCNMGCNSGCNVGYSGCCGNQSNSGWSGSGNCGGGGGGGWGMNQGACCGNSAGGGAGAFGGGSSGNGCWPRPPPAATLTPGMGGQQFPGSGQAFPPRPPMPPLRPQGNVGQLVMPPGLKAPTMIQPRM